MHFNSAIILKGTRKEWVGKKVEVLRLIGSKAGPTYALIEKPSYAGNTDGSWSGFSESLDEPVIWTNTHYLRSAHEMGFYWWMPISQLLMVPETNLEAKHLLQQE